MEHPFATGAPEWAIALEASSFAFAIRNSTWIYPLANLAHILGLAFLVGPIIVLDLRLAGLTAAGRIVELSRILTNVNVNIMLVLFPLRIAPMGTINGDPHLLRAGKDYPVWASKLPEGYVELDTVQIEFP